jgi:hypothetical protein
MCELGSAGTYCITAPYSRATGTGEQAGAEAELDRRSAITAEMHQLGTTGCIIYGTCRMGTSTGEQFALARLSHIYMTNVEYIQIW